LEYTYLWVLSVVIALYMLRNIFPFRAFSACGALKLSSSFSRTLLFQESSLVLYSFS
jgi:hypothetical protein